MKRLPTAKRWSQKKVAARIRAGYGQGRLSTYVPWIGIRDLSSKGTSSRMFSAKTGRMMQFLSNIERDTFLVAEFREDFVDFWEQWPLECQWTQLAAQQLGYRHPQYLGTTVPVVMTVDCVLTQRKNDGTVRTAIDCKHSNDVDNDRVREKFAIVKAACARQRLKHIVVTEQSTHTQVVKNILWVRIAVRKSGEIEPVQGAFDMWPMRMHRHLLQQFKDPAFAWMEVYAYCRWFEAENHLPRGLGLRCMKLLMWQHLVEFDLSAHEPERMTLSALTVCVVAPSIRSREMPYSSNVSVQALAARNPAARPTSGQPPKNRGQDD